MGEHKDEEGLARVFLTFPQQSAKARKNMCKTTILPIIKLETQRKGSSFGKSKTSESVLILPDMQWVSLKEFKWKDEMVRWLLLKK